MCTYQAISGAGPSGKTGPIGLDLLLGGLAAVFELHEHRRHVAVLTGHPEALGGNSGLLGQGQLSVLHALEEKYAKLECPVVSNNSAHRWTEDVPMVVPEISGQRSKVLPAPEMA